MRLSGSSLSSDPASTRRTRGLGCASRAIRAAMRHPAVPPDFTSQPIINTRDFVAFSYHRLRYSQSVHPGYLGQF